MAQKMKPMMEECFMIQSKNTKNPEIIEREKERERDEGDRWNQVCVLIWLDEGGYTIP